MITSALIDNDISFAMGLDEERLYELAKRNTPMILPMNIRGIDGTDYRQSGIIFATNSCFSIGAGVILYDNMLADLASEFGTDLYVMPNTVDESIIISGEMGFVVPDLHSHFLEAADSIFTPEERLSDIVYRFDAGKNKLVRASLKSLKTCKGDS